MDNCQFRALLSEALQINGMAAHIIDDIINKFRHLTERMLQVNSVMNITRITEQSDIILRHYIDSLTLLPYLPEGATVLDVGCGGGFPCLPIAIVRPDLQITAMDSTEKKVRYVNETASMLGLTNLQAITARAEEAAAPGSPLREHFDVVASRAVARLQILDELCLPFVKVGGSFVAMKGGRAAEELAEAKKGCALLGASEPILLPCSVIPPEGVEATPEEHALIIARKERKSLEIYPRKYAQILKKPL